MASSPPALSNAGSGNPAPPNASSAQPADGVAGIDLESALQVPPPEPPVSGGPLQSLAEPSGVFAPLPATRLPPEPDPTSDSSIAARFDKLLATVHQNRPNDDLDLIRRAWQFCIQQHTGQFRASGEPYIIHPLEVCQILADMKMDSTAIAAGLLHDAVEDTDVTSPEIAKRFNEAGRPHRRGCHQARQDQVCEP